jgi:hypothetical protein
MVAWRKLEMAKKSAAESVSGVSCKCEIGSYGVTGVGENRSKGAAWR